MSNPNGNWQFGVADLMALVTMTAAGLGLFGIVRGIKPIIDPIFLGVLLAGACGLCLAAFMGRNRRPFRALAILCSLAAAGCMGIVAALIARF